MSIINAKRGSYIQIPRELSLLFKDNPGAQKSFSAFLNALTAKVTGSNSSLEELEQRGGNPTFARVFELEKRVADLERMLRPVRREQPQETSEPRPHVSLAEINKRLDDIEASARPRG